MTLRSILSAETRQAQAGRQVPSELVGNSYVEGFTLVDRGHEISVWVKLHDTTILYLNVEVDFFVFSFFNFVL